MTTQKQIESFIAGQPEPKRSDLLALHRIVRKAMPACKLWLLDGKDDKGKVVTNPNIGYGAYTIKYADGKSREFYNIGISPNTTGVSVYIMGIKDKKYLAKAYAKEIGKASISGYCIKFKALKDINVEVLVAAIRDGIAAAREQ